MGRWVLGARVQRDLEILAREMRIKPNGIAVENRCFIHLMFKL